MPMPGGLKLAGQVKDVNLLNTVALHPWIDADQAAALAGCSPRWARLQLGQYVERGSLQSCRIAGLCTHGDLYALGTRGSREIARPDYATRGFMERALLRVEALWGVRNLLTIMAGQETLREAASPERAQYLAATGKQHTLYLDALGMVERSGRLIPFVVEWDLGEVSAESFRERFAALYRWRQASRYRADAARFPVIVIVTVHRGRAWRLAEVWQQAGRRGGVVLPCYVGVWGELVEGRLSAWYSASDPVRPTPLFHAVEGYSASEPFIPIETAARPAAPSSTHTPANLGQPPRAGLFNSL